MKLNNNIENQFRDKLNQRTIEPSDKAWDRLDAMLSVSEKKKPKRGWLWMAASLAMLLTVGSLFFKNNSENTIIFQNDDNLVVEQNNVEETSPDTIIQENVANDFVSEQDLTVQKTEPNKQNVLNDTFSIRQLNRNFQQLALEETKTESIEMSEEYNMNNIYLTADELLSSVEETNNKSKDKPKVEVDYRFLLSQSEYEVEERYRKKAIDRFLQKKYEDVRVVISNKNH